MSEGLLGGILGEEDEKPDVEAPDALAGAEAFASAVAARLAGNDPEVGNWPGAQQAYADAVALASDLPAAYYSWGVALARHGDPASAEAKLIDANKRGPHWADALKVWGDVLVKQGKIREALVKYDQALKYAANWKQLQEAREALGKRKS
jgi:tetratricopeptide (TPR) repeat protein